MAMDLLFGERSLTVVAAAFADSATARTTAQALARRLGRGGERQIDLVEPADQQMAVKLEPESEAIQRTAIRSHVALGLLGCAGGLLLGVAAAQRNWFGAGQAPVLTILIVGVFGMIAGMLLAGLLTLRPDRGAVADEVQLAAESGLWTVVAHPRNHAQARASSAFLAAAGGRLVRSL